MFSEPIVLESLEKIKLFVSTVSCFNTDFDIVSGRYCIDAKSIMGILSLDLSKPLRLEVHCDENDPEASNIREAIEPFKA